MWNSLPIDGVCVCDDSGFWIERRDVLGAARVPLYTPWLGPSTVVRRRDKQITTPPRWWSFYHFLLQLSLFVDISYCTSLLVKASLQRLYDTRGTPKPKPNERPENLSSHCGGSVLFPRTKGLVVVVVCSVWK